MASERDLETGRFIKATAKQKDTYTDTEENITPTLEEMADEAPHRS